MELPAPLLLVYTMAGVRDTLPPPPQENLILAGIYVCLPPPASPFLLTPNYQTD